MAELGADPGQPMVTPVHNVIKGSELAREKVLR
jgi:hypothetical protein